MIYWLWGWWKTNPNKLQCMLPILSERSSYTVLMQDFNSVEQLNVTLFCPFSATNAVKCDFYTLTIGHWLYSQRHSASLCLWDGVWNLVSGATTCRYPYPLAKKLGCSVTSSSSFGSHDSREKVGLQTKRRANWAMAVNKDVVGGVCSVYNNW